MSGLSPADGGEGVDPPVGPADWLETLVRHADRRRHHYLAIARYWMWRCRIGDASFTAEDAIQDAALELWRRHQAGTLRVAASLAEFDRWLGVALKQVIIDRGRHDRTGKRHGEGMVHLSMLEADIAEAVEDRAVGPERVASGREEVRKFLSRLRHRRPALHATAILKMEGRENHEIARSLNLSIVTVRRMVREIGSILESRPEGP